MEVRRCIYGEVHLEIAKSYNDIGVTYEALGDHVKALEFGEKALALFKSIHGDNHQSVALSYDNIGVAYAGMGNDKKALDSFLMALTLYKKILGTNCFEVARLYNNSGAYYGKMGNRDKELEFRLKALEIACSIKHDEYIAALLNRVAWTYKNRGQKEKAIDYFRQSAEKYRELGNEKQAKANLNEIDKC